MSMTKVEQTNVTMIEGMPLMKYCELIANTQLVPKGYQGKPADIFLAIKTGQDLGLNHLQSMKGITVINGVPSVWGDVAMSLVQVHPRFEDMQEYYDEKLEAAVCIIKRKGMSTHTSTFSMQDAKTAGLLGKDTWQKYPKRMLQMRARGKALKDRFSDALGGLILAEEAQDYPIDVTPTTRSDMFNQKLDALSVNHSRDPKPAPDEQTVADQTVEAALALTEEEARTALSEAINQYNIPQAEIDKWCERGGVTTLEELSLDHVVKCIDFIKTKSNKTTEA